NKVELLPWDFGHGYLDGPMPDDLSREDRWAELTLMVWQDQEGKAAFKELRALYREDEGFRVPAEWVQP
ncbi:MAG: hypothetical protein ACYCYF_06060, partial [Anaerolineae bacterium]